MIQEQAAAAVIIALISKKKLVKKKRKKRRVCVKPWLKRRRNLEFYETLLAELLLEEEYNYKILLLITSENPENPKENTKLRELIPPRL